MTTNRIRIYTIKTYHPTLGKLTGTFEAVVKVNPDATRYVVSSPFGCSRSYETDSDGHAIAKLLAEHATTLVDCQPRK